MSAFQLDEKLTEIYEIIDNIIEIKETSMIEFKKTFSMGSKYKYAKIVSSFANNKGGCILFGINEQTNEIVGLSNDNFENLDPSKITDLLSGSFDPEIIWDRTIITTSQNKKIGILYAHEAKEKPVICKRNTSVIKEGEIYYRYSGQTRKIRYSELFSMIKKEQVKLVNILFDKVKKIISLGVENTAILDTNKLGIHGDVSKVLIDETVLSQVELIKEGTITETNDTPTLRIIGDVEPATVITRTVVELITVYDIVLSFLTREIPENRDPLDFLKQIGRETSQNYPIHFFLKELNLSIEEIIQTIDQSLPGGLLKDRLIVRLKDNLPKPIIYKLGLRTNASKIRTTFFQSILDRSFNVEDIKTADELKYFLEGFTTLEKDQLDSMFDYLFPILLELFKSNLYKREAKSRFRNLLCYFDILLYSA